MTISVLKMDFTSFNNDRLALKFSVFNDFDLSIYNRYWNKIRMSRLSWGPRGSVMISLLKVGFK